MGIKIITDSTSYLNSDLQKKYNIEILSLNVTFNEDSFKEVDISNEDFYIKMEKEGIPISSQPALGEIIDSFTTAIEAGDDVVAVFLSSKMSGTYQSAILAKNTVLEQYPTAKIEVIDSTSNCMQLGFITLAAAKAALENKNFEEVVKITKDSIPKTRFIFIPDNLDYLQKGGRIGKASALIGNILKITPILTVANGETDSFKSVRTKKRAKAMLINQLLEDHQKSEVMEVCIHHINTKDEALSLYDDIKKVLDVNIFISDIGPVIGLHVGPKAIGLAYRTKKDLI